MSYRVKTSIFAKADRIEITKYLGQYSASAPIKFKSELNRYLYLIGEKPEIFAVFAANPTFRHVVVFGSYTMFYTISEVEKTVMVYRILHGAQDISGIL